jgi:CD9 antigen
MALGGCYNCLKYLMFVFNFIFWLVGCALLAVGIWAKVDEVSLTKMVGNDSMPASLGVAAWTLIIVGSIIMVLGFLGCCGAIRESQCMLALFFVALFIIFAALLAIGIYAYISFQEDPDVFRKGLKSGLEDCVRKYVNDTVCRERLDGLHKDSSCCGAEKGDFERIHGQAKAIEVCGMKYFERQGCVDKYVDLAERKLKDYLVVFVAIAFGVATIMLLGMIFAMLLCCAIRETMA